jgi:hypothetical protein
MIESYFTNFITYSDSLYLSSLVNSARKLHDCHYILLLERFHLIRLIVHSYITHATVNVHWEFLIVSCKWRQDRVDVTPLQ